MHMFNVSTLFRQSIKAVAGVDRPMKTPSMHIFFDFLLTVKAAPHECVIRTGQP